MKGSMQNIYILCVKKGRGIKKHISVSLSLQKKLRKDKAECTDIEWDKGVDEMQAWETSPESPLSAQIWLSQLGSLPTSLKIILNQGGWMEERKPETEIKWNK